MQWGRLVEKDFFSSEVTAEFIQKINIIQSYNDFSNVECIFEVVSENMHSKREVFSNLAKQTSSNDILISNTSSLSMAPGFTVNRMLIPMINEAIGILAEGVAGAEEIDQAMCLGANHPIGPLALDDLIGILL